jgi:hypothetical protein
MSPSPEINNQTWKWEHLRYVHRALAISSARAVVLNWRRFFSLLGKHGEGHCEVSGVIFAWGGAVGAH